MRVAPERGVRAKHPQPWTGDRTGVGSSPRTKTNEEDCWQNGVCLAIWIDTGTFSGLSSSFYAAMDRFGDLCAAGRLLAPIQHLGTAIFLLLQG